MESEEYQNDRSLSKIETLELLKDTIDRLETVVREIDSKTSEELPDLASVQTLAKTIENLGIAVKNPQSNPQLATPKRPSATKTRSKPAKTSKNNLRAIALLSGTVVLIVAGFWFWLSPQPLFLNKESAPPIEEPVEDIPEVAIEAPEISENPVVVSPVETASETKPIEDREPEIPNTIIPIELTAPGEAENIPLKLVEVPLQLTPEQSLIAAVRERISEITQDYSEDLILSIRADFTDSKLGVKVSNDWYELSDSSQSKLADEILKRSRKLDFQKLELTDADDNLIARSPVVGDRAIIYSKQQAVIYNNSGEILRD